ncbi:MAG TPA: Stp1/IreP family PP2C-type Ser/Thr phosphatase [Gaiellaceae bacterium]|nr:Stp1/IreP family PP2C-type Ser/Thr phosphatase [Gaiellaceae bacterium]
MRVGRSTVATHTGRKRRHNEDAYVLQPPLFAIADGMGGARAGEVASSLAAAALQSGEVDGNGKERVTALIQAANRRVYERSSQDAEVAGMGTTMTVALVEDGTVTLGHVGDSRAYVLRDGELEQLTDDHSLVAELVRGGKLSAEEAEHHPQRSVITRALGTDPDVDVDTFTVEAEDGDVFVLCSDGLTDMVGDDEIGEVLAGSRENLKEAAEELVRRANKAGGQDNITVVAFEMTDEPDEQTLERTVEQTQPMPAAEATSEPERRRIWRFLPLLILLLGIAAAAIALWILVR